MDAVRARRELVLENAMLRHQLIILRRKAQCPSLTTLDRLHLLIIAIEGDSYRRREAQAAKQAKKPKPKP
jgi:hypothetical protein